MIDGEIVLKLSLWKMKWLRCISIIYLNETPHRNRYFIVAKDSDMFEHGTGTGRARAVLIFTAMVMSWTREKLCKLGNQTASHEISTSTSIVSR